MEQFGEVGDGGKSVKGVESAVEDRTVERDAAVWERGI